MNENDSQPIGEAQPMDSNQACEILKRIGLGTIVGLSVGGFAAFSLLLTPTRLSGASRSARLLWQNRQKEISEIIKQQQINQPAAQDARQTGDKASFAK